MSKINSLGPDTDYNNGAIQMSSQGYLDLMKVNGGQNLYWTTDINVELPIKMQSTGIGS
jgi:long-chain-fatty-acid--CoA ligase ACSBG